MRELCKRGLTRNRIGPLRRMRVELPKNRVGPDHVNTEIRGATGNRDESTMRQFTPVGSAKIRQAPERNAGNPWAAGKSRGPPPNAWATEKLRGLTDRRPHPA